jgi:hypothetical protein
MVKKPDRWRTNASAVKAFFKKPKGWALSGYFYTGPTRDFGHFPPTKGGKKKS